MVVRGGELAVVGDEERQRPPVRAGGNARLVLHALSSSSSRMADRSRGAGDGRGDGRAAAEESCRLKRTSARGVSGRRQAEQGRHRGPTSRSVASLAQVRGRGRATICSRANVILKYRTTSLSFQQRGPVFFAEPALPAGGRRIAGRMPLERRSANLSSESIALPRGPSRSAARACPKGIAANGFCFPSALDNAWISSERYDE